MILCTVPFFLRFFNKKKEVTVVKPFFTFLKKKSGQLNLHSLADHDDDDDDDDHDDDDYDDDDDDDQDCKI